MKSSRFEFALAHTTLEHAYRFEVLVGSFMASALGTSFRPLGGNVADQGRDGVLLSSDEATSKVVQVSVQKDWKRKVADTLTRLDSTNYSASEVFFVFPFKVGAAGVDEKFRHLRDGRRIDILDGDWILAQQFQSLQTKEAAEAYSKSIVDPLLPELSNRSVSARAGEAAIRDALVLMTTMETDQNADRNIQKLAVESIVLSLLRLKTEGSSVQDLSAAVGEVIAWNDGSVVSKVEGALGRLKTKKRVSFETKLEIYKISYKERIRLEELESNFYIEYAADLRRQLTSAAFELFDTELFANEADSLCKAIVDICERFGSGLAGNLLSHTVNWMPTPEAELLQQIQLRLDSTTLPRLSSDQVASIVETVLYEPTQGTAGYLRMIRSAGALLSLFRTTADVQSVLEAFLFQGQIWMDTSALLPVFAEQSLPTEHRRLTKILLAASEAGFEFFVIPGVIAELATHINRNRSYWSHRARFQSWEGRIPFLYSEWLISKSEASFLDTLELFCGVKLENAEDDVAHYLSDFLRVKVRDLSTEALELSLEERSRISEYWLAASERRRGPTTDPFKMRLLAQHDATTCQGIVALRRRETPRETFQAWWMSNDGRAQKFIEEINPQLERSASPFLITLGYLVEALTFGPGRRRVDSAHLDSLPFMLGTAMYDEIGESVLAKFEDSLAEYEGLPPHIVRRRLRDLAEEMKGVRGPDDERVAELLRRGSSGRPST